MAQELDLAAKCTQLEVKVRELENEVEKSRNHDREQVDGIDKDQEQLKEGNEDNVEPKDRERVQQKRKLKRQRQKEKKATIPITLPKVGEEVLFKNKNESEWHRARVIKTYKKTSIHKNFRHLKLENGSVIEKDLVDEVDWCRLDTEEHPEEFEIQDITNNDTFPVKLIPKEEWNKPDYVSRYVRLSCY